MANAPGASQKCAQSALEVRWRLGTIMPERVMSGSNVTCCVSHALFSNAAAGVQCTGAVQCDQLRHQHCVLDFHALPCKLPVALNSLLVRD